MKFKPVKIDEGGFVTMKDEEKKKLYTEKEAKLGEKFCATINADKELKNFHAERGAFILKEFAKTIILAYLKKDTQLTQEALNRAGELLKALTTHIHIKVKIKEKEVK